MNTDIAQTQGLSKVKKIMFQLLFYQGLPGMSSNSYLYSTSTYSGILPQYYLCRYNVSSITPCTVLCTSTLYQNYYSCVHYAWCIHKSRADHTSNAQIHSLSELASPFELASQLFISYQLCTIIHTKYMNTAATYEDF